MRNLFFGFIVLFSINDGFSQMHHDSIPEWQITVSPSAIFNVYPGLQVGVEKRMASKLRLELEGAYLIPSSYSSGRRNEGLRSKLGLKYQFNERDQLNLILFYRKLFIDELVEYSRFEEAYFERIQTLTTKRLIGPTLGVTSIIEMGKNILEVGASGGVGTYKVVTHVSDLPADAVRGERGISFDAFNDPGTYLFPIISFQLKLKFGL